MPGHRALLLAALFALFAFCSLSAFYGGAATPPVIVGPDKILYMDADTVFYLRSQAWWDANVKHEEKLLLRGLRLRYWVENIPPDMRYVYDALGYPASRVILKPVGHTEEWWYYKLLDPPLRFRDGILLDPDRFEAILARQ